MWEEYNKNIREFSGAHVETVAVSDTLQYISYGDSWFARGAKWSMSHISSGQSQIAAFITQDLTPRSARFVSLDY